MKARGQRFFSTVTSLIFKKQIIILVLGTMLLGLLYQPGVAGERYPFHFAPPVKVMTQNLYVGADIFYPAGATTPEEFLQRLDETFAVILETNIYERARAIAKEVACHRPHLIGLQEVYQIQRQDPSQQVALDYLSILTDALKAEGLDYNVAGTVENLNLQIPIPLIPPYVGFVALLDRDVILARGDVVTTNPFWDNYDNTLPVNLPFGTLQVLRGYVAVKAEVEGKEYIFVNTHLELRGTDFDPPIPEISGIQAAQAYELIDELFQVLAQKPLPIILVGDLNSSPEDPVIHVPDDGEIIPPYKQLRMAGYADVWKRSLVKKHNSGFTCCQAEDLSNKKSLVSERIDYIFVRNNPGDLPVSILGPVVADLVGEERKDKTEPSRLWPSDHAGVVARMLIPTFK
jgi:endonuclease/exonuclease/phosphatase family metal-dependent hydrolase